MSACQLHLIAKLYDKSFQFRIQLANENDRKVIFFMHCAARTREDRTARGQFKADSLLKYMQQVR